MAARDRPHLLIPSAATAEPYRRPGSGGGGEGIAGPSNRQVHARQLSQQLQQAQRTAARQQSDQDFAVAGAIDGVYIQFESFPGVRLALESLDPRSTKPHPELVSVQDVNTPAGVVEYATVFVPDGTLGYFMSRLLTLIAQDTIHPFYNGTMREMHLHDLPWPADILADLGDATVRLRVIASPSRTSSNPTPAGAAGNADTATPRTACASTSAAPPNPPTTCANASTSSPSPRRNAAPPTQTTPDAGHSAPHSAPLAPSTPTFGKVPPRISPTAARPPYTRLLDGGRTTKHATAATSASATRSSSRSKPRNKTSTSGHQSPSRSALRFRSRSRHPERGGKRL